MSQINRTSQINSSVLRSALAGLSKKIAPLVQAELAGVLIAELERHFNEKLLPDLRQRVEDIVARELDRKVEEIVFQELGRREAVGCRPNFLEQRFTEVYGKALWGDDETRSGWGSKRDSGHVQTALEILRMVIRNTTSSRSPTSLAETLIGSHSFLAITRKSLISATTSSAP